MKITNYYHYYYFYGQCQPGKRNIILQRRIKNSKIAKQLIYKPSGTALQNYEESA